MVTEKVAIKKYGKKTYIKMLEFLDGITISYNDNGEADIPESDLELAYDLVSKGRSYREWD